MPNDRVIPVFELVGQHAHVSMKPRYIPGFHGLRAIACLGVFCVHLQQLTKIAGRCGPVDVSRLMLNGNTGVAIFFMLSGLLLSLPVWHANRAPLRPLRFAVNRTVRIIPAYYVCLTVLVLLKKQWSSVGGLISTALHYAFLHNLTDRTFYAINSPFWTIAVQAQYYLLFGLILSLLYNVRKASRGILFAVFVMLAVGSYGVHRGLLHLAAHSTALDSLHGLVAADGPVVTRSLIAHLPLFFLGATLGRFFLHLPLGSSDRRVGMIWDAATILAGAVIVAILATSLDDQLQIPGGRYNLPYIPLLLTVLIVGVPRSFTVLAMLEATPIRWLGTISYGFYLYHEPCLQFAAKAQAIVPVPEMVRTSFVAVGGFAIALALSSASFVWFERPLMRKFKPESVIVKGEES